MGLIVAIAWAVLLAIVSFAVGFWLGLRKSVGLVKDKLTPDQRRQLAAWLDEPVSKQVGL